MKNTIKFVTGNSKLNKFTSVNGNEYRIVGFGIPADLDFNDNGKHRNTCAGAKDCRSVCYAKQGMYNFSNVKKARMEALEQTLAADFVEKSIAGLTKFAKSKFNVVRVHDSGDFYSQEYLEKWYAIAAAVPQMKFYAYTKALNLDLWTNKPDNFQIVQSLGGVWDKRVDVSKPHSRIFVSEEERIAAGYVDGNLHDGFAIEGFVNIGLVYHGNKNMSTQDKAKFSLPVVR